MGRCSNDVLLSKVTEAKLSNRLEVYLSIHKELPDCRDIRTDDYVSVSGVDTSWSRITKPESVYECFPKDCVTTGTLFVGANEGTASATYYIPFDATEWGAGIITFYVYRLTSSAQTLTVTIGSTAGTGENYEVTVPAGDPKTFAPVLIDLTTTPTSGTWTPTAGGAYLTISGTTDIAISSISVYDSIDDFELDDVVVLACLTSIGGTIDIEAIEATCMEKGHQADPTGFDYPVTAKAVTPNWYKLNPLNKKGEATVDFSPRNVQETIVADGTKGVVTLLDAYQDECGFITAQVVDCSPIDGSLKKVSVPFPIDLDEDQYQVIKNDDGTTSVYFNGVLVGREVIISYPQIAHVEQTVGANDALNTTHVKMSVPIEITKGESVVAKEIHVFHNVLVTSFPTTITSEETEFAFTFHFMPDDDGIYYHINRINTIGQTAVK